MGLYVQAKYNDFTTKRETENILDAERKELFVSLELLHKEKRS